MHAICEDYRAAAGIDLEHDAASADRKIDLPLLAQWGARDSIGKQFDVLATWRERASDVSGHSLDCGHSLQEERPDELFTSLLAFLV